MLQIIKEEFERRVISEGLTRIRRCIDLLDEERLWYKHNNNTNSAGNIVLHLCGNVRQYIISGIGGQPDERKRDKEFLLSSRTSKAALVERISDVLIESNRVVSSLSKEDMTTNKLVQGFEETVLSIIIHVIEHLSYHVGQITYYTKYVNDIDTGYYEGQDLNITS